MVRAVQRDGWIACEHEGRPTGAEVVDCDRLFSSSAGVGLRLWQWEPWWTDGKKAPHSFEVRVSFRVELPKAAPPADEAEVAEPAEPAEEGEDAEGAEEAEEAEGVEEAEE